MKIRFLTDQVFERDGPGRGPRFAANSVLAETDVGAALGMDNVPKGYAEAWLRRWLQRGVAVEVAETKAVAEAKPAPVAEPKAVVQDVEKAVAVNEPAPVEEPSPRRGRPPRQAD